jgi:hypothetical protein
MAPVYQDGTGGLAFDTVLAFEDATAGIDRPEWPENDGVASMKR